MSTTKELVDAIIDAQDEARSVMEMAAKEASTLSGRMALVARALVRRRLSGRLTPKQCMLLFKRAWLEFSLLGFTHVAQDVVDVAEKHGDKVVAVARKLGKDVKATQVIRKLDVEARRTERDGEQ